MSELIAGATAAGISVGVSEEGPRCPLPANVDLAGYRILQEALTNTARHAPGASVAVRVAYQGAGLVLQVNDDGPAGPGRAGPGGAGPARGWPGRGWPGRGWPGRGRPGRGRPGRGRAGPGCPGRRERDRRDDRTGPGPGRHAAGPGPGGGFRVRAWLPLDGGGS